LAAQVGAEEDVFVILIAVPNDARNGVPLVGPGGSQPLVAGENGAAFIFGAYQDGLEYSVFGYVGLEAVPLLALDVMEELGVVGLGTELVDWDVLNRIHGFPPDFGR